MTAPTLDKNMLDLHMPQDPDGSSAAVAPLAWCVTDRLMDAVRSNGFRRPHLLIINRAMQDKRQWDGSVVKAWVDKKVTIAPLTQALQYINFVRPGENDLQVFVIDIRSKEQFKEARFFANWIQNRGAGEEDSIVDTYGELTPGRYETMPILEHGVLNRRAESLTVHVPAEMFAPEPAEWRKALVRKFFTMREVDQCHFRKRFLLSLLFTVPVIVFNYVAKTLAAVLGYGLLGFRGYDWQHFLRPFSSIVNFIPDDTVYFSYLEEERHSNRSDRLKGRTTHKWWTFLNPLTILIALFILAVVGFDNFAVGVGVVLLVGALAAVAVFVYSRYINTADHSARKIAARDAARDKERQRLLADLEKMNCKTNLPANSVADLPREKQTVTLRFYDFKTKVCRPFAR